MFPDYFCSMTCVTILEVKTHLSNCLERIVKGERIIIRKRNGPIAELISIQRPVRGKRPIGLAGQEYPGFRVDQSFFDPLPDDLAAAFSGEIP